MLAAFSHVLFGIFYHVDIINEFKSSTSIILDSSSSSFSPSIDQSLFGIENLTYNNNNGVVNAESVHTLNNTKNESTNVMNASQLLPEEIHNVTNYRNSTIDSSNLDSGEDLMPSAFRIDQYLRYPNIYAYFIEIAATAIDDEKYSENNGSANQFLTYYATQNGIYAFIIFASIALSNDSIFYQIKAGDIKESTKLILNLLGILMCIFLTAMEIPMLSILFQGYRCSSEKSGVDGAVACDSLTHSLLVVVSSLMIVIYMAFQILQNILYTTNSFEKFEEESEVPWRSFERTVYYFRLLLKIVISIGIVFEAEIASKKGLLFLLCFFIQGYIVFRRTQCGEIALENSVHYASLLYESLSTWLFLTVGLHLMTGKVISIATLSLLLLIGVIIACSLIAHQAIKAKETLVFDKYEEITDPVKYIFHFFRLYQVIAKANQKVEYGILLQGKLRKHVQICNNPQCPCLGMIEYFDDNQRVKELLVQYAKRQQKQLNAMDTGPNGSNSVYAPTIMATTTAGITQLGETIPAFDLKNSTTNMSLGQFPQYHTTSDTRPIVHQVAGAAAAPQLNPGEELSLILEPCSNLIFQKTAGDEKTTFQVNQEASVDQFKEVPPPIVQSSILNTGGGLTAAAAVASGGSQNKLFQPDQQFFQGSSYQQQSNVYQSYAQVRSSGKPSFFLNEDNIQKIFESPEKPRNTGLEKYQSEFNSQVYYDWLAQKRKKMAFEDTFNRIFDNNHDPEKIKHHYFKLLAMLIKDAIERFPESVDLRIINATVQKEKLNNEFKAIFEMMNCELCHPNIQQKMVIFRQKIAIEHKLVKQYQKNIQKIGIIDVMQVFNYERLHQKYQLYEYLTTYSAKCFWKELLSKQINAGHLQDQGSQISKFYEIIQRIAKRLLVIYPNEIKFLFRYGNFLLHIMHNEYDALENYRLAQGAFQMKITKKGGTAPVNEQSIFGENSGSAIVVISATSTSIGIINHCNEEIESVLRYRRKELIGKNVSVLIPRPIAKVHDKLIQRYFETAKPNVIEIQRQLFGVTKEGYLQEIDLVVKVIPQMNDKILFVGFLQKSTKFDDMEQPHTEYESYDKQYLVTDSDGNITNVTEGLNIDLGLNAKFFQYTDSIFQQMFNIQKICSDLHDRDIQDILEVEGKNLIFDTTSILTNLELELLNSEEILEVKSNLGKYQIYVQVKKLTVSTYCKLNIYRLIPIGKYQQDQHLIMMGSIAAGINASRMETLALDSDIISGEDPINGGGINNSMSASMSSASGSVSFNRVIKDFKKALGERRTPRTIIFLQRIISIIFIASIILSSVNFATIQTETDTLSEGNDQGLLMETRSLKLIQLASNVRSLINVANKLEYNDYDGAQLTHFDRFEYLELLVLNQATNLQDIHQRILKKRQANAQGGGSKDDDFEELQSMFEYEPIEIFRLDDSNQVNSYSQPYRVALITYLNQILSLNQTDRSYVTLPQSLLNRVPYSNKSFTIGQNTTLLQKQVFFLMVNGLRNLRMKTEEASRYFKINFHKELQKASLLPSMLVGIVLSLSFFLVLVYQLWVIQKNQAQILSLYAYLQPPEIFSVYKASVLFMNNLNKGSILNQLFDQSAADQEAVEGGQDQLKNSMNIKSVNNSQQMSSKVLGDSKGRKKKGGNTDLAAIEEEDLQYAEFTSKKIAIGSFGFLKVSKRRSEMSEDEKEEIEQKDILEKRKKQRLLENKVRNKKYGMGQDIQAEMIKKTFLQERMILEKEDFTNQANQLAAKTAAALAFKHEMSRGPHMAKGGFKNKVIRKRKSVSQAALQKKGKVDNKKAGVGQHESMQQMDQKIFNQQSNAAAAIRKRESLKKKKASEDPLSGSDDESDEEEKQSYEKNHSSQKSNTASDEEADSKSAEKKLQKSKIQRQQSSQSRSIDNELLVDEQQMLRNKQFFSTIKSKNWGKIIGTLCITAVLIAYFIQLYTYNMMFKSQLKQIQDYIPVFMNRFRDPMLGYAFMREKILYNSTLDFIEEDPIYGHNIDILKIDESMGNELKLASLKNSQPNLIADLLNFFKTMDSENFCKDIIGNSSFTLTFSIPSDIDVVSSEAIASSKPYESYIQAIGQAQEAAIIGNVTKLKLLKGKGMDLNSINYDRRTPLHFAAKYGQIDTVKYLLSDGADLNLRDRWGATALTYSSPYPKLEQFLLNLNATYGTDSEDYTILASAYQDKRLSDDDLRSFYASYYNDIRALAILNAQKKLDVKATDRDGRTALSIASSQNNKEAVEYLIMKGADPFMRDARYHSAIQDARRNNETSSIASFLEQLSDLRVIFNNCGQFENGLLSKGYQQALSNFHKRFSDLQIKFNNSLTKEQRLSLFSSPLVSEPPDGQGAHKTMKIFFSTQELYIHAIIEKMVSIMSYINAYHISEYSQICQLLFLLFIAFQIFIIMLMLLKIVVQMKEDIFQSRGILNLIPDTFFEQNRSKVEQLIKDLKD